MCYAKPGPRCSPHMAAALEKAESRLTVFNQTIINSTNPPQRFATPHNDADKKKQQRLYKKYRESRDAYDSTPEGQKRLQDALENLPEFPGAKRALFLDRLEKGKNTRATQEKEMAAKNRFEAAEKVEVMGGALSDEALDARREYREALEEWYNTKSGREEALSKLEKARKEGNAYAVRTIESDIAQADFRNERIRREETAKEHDRRAAEAYQRSHESFERSDTDGFLSQFANDISGDGHRMKAELERKGNKAEFVALYDTEGNIVPAKRVSGKYGVSWGLLESDDPHGGFTGYVNTSSSSNPETKRKYLERKGYVERVVLAPAKVSTVSNGGSGLSGITSVRNIITRADGGFSRDVTPVE